MTLPVYIEREKGTTMNPSEKAAYIKGLMEGMKFDTTTDEGKLISKIVDLLEDLSLSVQDLEDEVAQLNDFTDELDEDLGAVEEELYGECDCCCDDDDCCCDDDCCDDDCDCGCCDGEEDK